MQMAQFLDSLQTDLEAVAAVGDDAVGEAARRLSAAIRSSAGLRLLEALGDVALEVSAQLPGGHVEVRLAGPDPQLVYVEEEQEAAAPAAAPDDEASARITLRLPEGLKATIEAVAGREGVSVNAWIVRALAREVSGPSRGPRVGKRLTGFAKS
ncbi:MAG TPA: YlcI/YnfO family protein [Gaiellaceae bacterium]|nr:YlcI/YnfO family protein [Gaiellaceae bacterium]